MKAVVLGAGGQLGRELAEAVPPDIKLKTYDRSNLDLTDPGGIATMLGSEAPDVILNAGAYTAVDKAESEVSEARAANVEGPRLVAMECAKVGARLVHFSTDFVFDGVASTAYSTTAPTAPISVYGKTKLEGEKAVLAALPDRSIVIRSSWLYSEYGSNFVKTILRLLREREDLAVVADQIGCPTWAAGLAHLAWRFVERPSASGVFHWSDSGQTSWYDFAVSIQEIALDLELMSNAIPIRGITTAEYPTAAKRPKYSVLDCTETVDFTGFRQMPWKTNLRQMLQRVVSQ